MTVRYDVAFWVERAPPKINPTDLPFWGAGATVSHGAEVGAAQTGTFIWFSRCDTDASARKVKACKPPEAPFLAKLTMDPAFLILAILERAEYDHLELQASAGATSSATLPATVRRWKLRWQLRWKLRSCQSRCQLRCQLQLRYHLNQLRRAPRCAGGN